MKITIISSVMMFPPLGPICRRRLSRKKRFLKFSSEKHISQDTSQNQTFIISSPKWISTHMQMRENRKAKAKMKMKGEKIEKQRQKSFFRRDFYSTWWRHWKKLLLCGFLWLPNLTNSDCFNRPIHEALVRQASSWWGVFVCHTHLINLQSLGKGAQN